MPSANEVAQALRRFVGAQHTVPALVGLLAIALGVLPAGTDTFAQRRGKLPTPKRLDVGIELRRDAATGELRYFPVARGALGRTVAAPGTEAATPAGPAIRARVNLVEVSLNVLEPDGSHVRGLMRDDFRIFEDGAEQQIAHFDASSEPASVALVLDASPSVLRELEQMKQAARTFTANLAPVDEVAVVAFATHTFLLQPFSRDRALLERAIEQVDVLRGPGEAPGSNIYLALYLTALELFRARTGRKAIVLLTDGQDSGLGLSWDPASTQPRGNRLSFEDVCRVLTAAGIEAYVVSTQNRPQAMTEQWLAAQADKTLLTPKARELGIVHYTLYLAELVRRVGGRLYFLREIGALSEVYRRIAENLRAQYTLGYYPTAGVAKPGWRALRVDVRGRSDVRLTHRAAYYVPSTSH